MKCLVGAFVASAIELRLAAAPVIEVVHAFPIAPTSVITNEMLDRIYAQLCEAVSAAWMQGFREELSKNTSSPEFVVITEP